MIVFLMLGLGFGSVFFPRTVTQTVTQTAVQTTTRTATLTITGNSSATLVTATVITLLVDHYVATCTTISGTRSIVYAPLFPGETTTVTTAYPQHVPQQFQVTLTTVTTVTGSNQTIVEESDTC